MKVFLSSDMEGTAGINALVAAHYRVPVVLVTGDRCACEETAALIPGVRTGPREPRFHGEDPLAVYRSFCAAILLTRTIAEAP
jgi:D-aminopeptidase